MDESIFDQLTRSFALPSRRAVFSALGAAIVPALFAQDGSDDAHATPKRGKRRQDAAAVRATGKKGKKKGKKKKKKKKGGKGREPVCTEELGSEAACEPLKPLCWLDGASCTSDLPCCGCCDEGGTCQHGDTIQACGGPMGGICDICVDHPQMVCQDRSCCIPT